MRWISCTARIGFLSFLTTAAPAAPHLTAMISTSPERRSTRMATSNS